MRETERLCLRPWREEDAPALYRLASDPRVGPPCGWKPHASEAESLEILRRVLITEDNFAVTLRGSDEPIGSIGLRYGDPSCIEGPELGYWLGVPYWGRGYTAEAASDLIALAFERGASCVWAAHFEGNERSRRVMEKCGLRYRFSREFAGSDGISHITHYHSIKRGDWQP